MTEHIRKIAIQPKTPKQRLDNEQREHGTDNSDETVDGVTRLAQQILTVEDFGLLRKFHCL